MKLDEGRSIQTRMDRRLVLVMAVATGMSVANLYYAQPLLPVMGQSLHLAPHVTGFIVTAGQVGYATGLLLLLPLGDLLERRRLVTTLSVGTAAALLWFGASPSVGYLLPAALAVGLMAVLAQVLCLLQHRSPRKRRGAGSSAWS